jgi:hypothetical protein
MLKIDDHKTIQCPQFEGTPAASATLTCRLPIGYKYHNLYFTLTGVTGIGSLSYIRMRQNGRVFFEMTGTDLDSYNQFKKIPAFATSARVFIPLALPGMKNTEDEDEGAINTGVVAADGKSIQTFDCQIVLNSSGAAAVVGTPRAYVSAPDASPAHIALHSVMPTIESAAVNGTNIYSRFPFSLGKNINHMFLNTIYFIGASNPTALTSFILKQNAQNVVDTTVALNRAENNAYGFRTDQANYLAIDFTRKGNFSPLPIYSNYDVRLEVVTSNTMSGVTLYCDTLGIID